jgi:hypothetical protein
MFSDLFRLSLDRVRSVGVGQHAAVVGYMQIESDARIPEQTRMLRGI